MSGIREYRGLSLVELMIIAVIVVVLLTLALPSFLDLIQRYRLVSTMEGLFYHLEYARSEALKEANTVYVSFQTGNSWCYGLNAGSACNCSTPSTCGLGSFTSPTTETTLSLNGFSSLSFDGSRGTASSAGTITLTVTGGTQSMGIDVGTVGNAQLCSNTISGYSAC